MSARGAKGYWCLFIQALVVIAFGSLFAASCLDMHDKNHESESDNGINGFKAESDGIWIDPSTGLMWQKTAMCCFQQFQLYAEEACEKLNINGVTGWRIPTISELRSIVRGCPATVEGGECDVTDDCRDENCFNDSCRGCEYEKGPGGDGDYLPDELSDNGTDEERQQKYYWSSTFTYYLGDDLTNGLWAMQFEMARIAPFPYTEKLRVRCVKTHDFKE